MNMANMGLYLAFTSTSGIYAIYKVLWYIDVWSLFPSFSSDAQLHNIAGLLDGLVGGGAVRCRDRKLSHR